VSSISTDNRVIQVGQQTVTDIDISFDADQIDNGTHIRLVVRLPAEVSFVPGSSEIDGLTTVDDNSVSPAISLCASGAQYLAFDFSGVDLLLAGNPSGDGDMRLNLTIAGVQVGTDAIIQASANDEQPDYTCDAEFVSEAEALVSVQ